MKIERKEVDASAQHCPVVIPTSNCDSTSFILEPVPRRQRRPDRANANAGVPGPNRTAPTTTTSVGGQAAASSLIVGGFLINCLALALSQAAGSKGGHLRHRPSSVLSARGAEPGPLSHVPAITINGHLFIGPRGLGRATDGAGCTPGPGPAFPPARRAARACTVITTLGEQCIGDRQRKKEGGIRPSLIAKMPQLRVLRRRG